MLESLNEERVQAMLYTLWTTRNTNGGKARVYPRWRHAVLAFEKAAAAEATAAIKARVREWAVRPSSNPAIPPTICRLCLHEWAYTDPEKHAPGCPAAPDAQPCAAEVEP